MLTQTYEDGDTVTYKYDNNGALAKVTDSATGIATTYYYDLSDRMMKYTESGAGYSHGVEYTYDEKNNLTKLEETIGGVDHVTEYDYDDDNRIKTVTANGATITYTYDAFGRVTEKVTKQGSTEVRKETFTYVTGSNGAVSAQVATHTVDSGMVFDRFEYTYDGNGNITKIETTYYTVNYTYDSANQLIREDNDGDRTTRVWTYDDAGNILSRKEYNYTTGSLEGVTPIDTYDYTYGHDSQWGDLLTSYDSDPIEYDAIGNPTDDLSWEYTWEHGRQLASMCDGSDTWNFTYNADGMRTQRTDGDTTYNYIYNGSQLTQMTADGHTLTFTYDAEGRPSTVTMDDETYYYVTNLQGDVLFLVDTDLYDVVRYSYSAWGECYWDGDPVLGALNPLTYRGYVYDQETGLYYLQSRYYNPEIGRFINADAFTATGQGLLGNNMFAYCGNNPVLFRDTTGTRHEISAGGGAPNRNRNIENIMNLWGVNTVDDIPDIPDNTMLFLENVYSETIGGVSYILGRTVVMDNDKYCEYFFTGVGYGVSGIPYDYYETVGYVYGVEDVTDFEGFFYGGSFNQLMNVSGGAFASNGVYSEILYGEGLLSPSLGASITYYSTPQSKWVYDKADIIWRAPIHRIKLLGSRTV